MKIERLRLNGQEARAYLEELANLRLLVFREFPYLYQGSLEYEKKYLETYFKAQHSFILLLKDADRIIGATTGIWAQEEEESFRQPFVTYGINPAKVFYYGESVILPQYRGKGLGKVFFEERERYARTMVGIEWLAFCAVIRSPDHPLKPGSYRPLNEFWNRQGFKEAEGLTTQYEWQDLDRAEATHKLMQFWLKKI